MKGKKAPSKSEPKSPSKAGPMPSKPKGAGKGKRGC